MSQEIDIHEFCPETMMPKSCTWMIIGPPGSGKCLHPDTLVKMYDSTNKKAKDIARGDQLMGDDSKPRLVYTTCSGTDKMYKIQQEYAEDYIVNEPHILCLRKTKYPEIANNENAKLWTLTSMTKNGHESSISFSYTDENMNDVYEDINNEYENLISNFESYEIYHDIEISVSDYLKKDDKFKSEYKGYRHQMTLPKCTETQETFSTNQKLSISLFESKGDLDVDTLRQQLEKIKHGSFDLRQMFITPFLKEAMYDYCYTVSWNCYYPEIIVKLLSDIFASLGFGTYTLSRTDPDFNVNLVPSEVKSVLYIKTEKTWDIDVEYIGMGEYVGFQISENGRFLLGDFTVTHNTTFIENLCYDLKHIYPVARIFIGNPGGHKRFGNIFGGLYVNDEYNEDEEKMHIDRQKKCIEENGSTYVGNYAINILDDISDDPKIFKSKNFRGLLKIGSQHWAQLCMIGSQYAIDMPPDLRSAVSFVAIFFQPEKKELKKLYENFGGLAGTFEEFCDLMEQVTGDHRCLIFRKRADSYNREKNIFWYRTTPRKEWEFGCKEYRSWNKKRGKK